MLLTHQKDGEERPFLSFFPFSFYLLLLLSSSLLFFVLDFFIAEKVGERNSGFNIEERKGEGGN